MEDDVRTFLENNHDALMVTLKKDGTPHVARVSVGLVDGRLWSSGTQDRVRTGHVRRDPRATVAVLHEETRFRWLGIETKVTIHDGDDAVEKNLALYRVLAGEPEDLEEYKQAMVKERRLIYEFSIERTYGAY